MSFTRISGLKRCIEAQHSKSISQKDDRCTEAKGEEAKKRENISLRCPSVATNIRTMPTIGDINSEVKVLYAFRWKLVVSL